MERDTAERTPGDEVVRNEGGDPAVARELEEMRRQEEAPAPAQADAPPPPAQPESTP